MKSEKNSFYIYSPDGDVMLGEIFEDATGTVTLLIGENRYELDRDSASELGEKLIFATMNGEYNL